MRLVEWDIDANLPLYTRDYLMKNQYGVRLCDWMEYEALELTAGRRVIPFDAWRNEGPQGEIKV